MKRQILCHRFLHTAPFVLAACRGGSQTCTGKEKKQQQEKASTQQHTHENFLARIVKTSFDLDTSSLLNDLQYAKFTNLHTRHENSVNPSSVEANHKVETSFN